MIGTVTVSSHQEMGMWRYWLSHEQGPRDGELLTL